MTTNDVKRYEEIDLPFYREQVAPLLPAQVLDFHAHTWNSEDWRDVPWQTGVRGGDYMITERQYEIERMLADGHMSFPDRPYNAVCFGYPAPSGDLQKTNEYMLQAMTHDCLFPLFVTGRNTTPVDELRNAMCDRGFFGYKVGIIWQGNDYGGVTIDDMLGPAELALADELNLIVLWHVPGSDRLADPAVQQGIKDVALQYPGAQIVLAHCGRCYMPDEMKRAIGAIKDLANVHLDSSMVMDPTVLEIILDNIDSRRLLYATDFPVAAMRGRRVYAMDHWVDIVLEGYPKSQFRIVSDDMRATFMSWEIALAIGRAAAMTGLTDAQTKSIFYDNGMALLERVRNSKRGDKE